MNLADIDKYLHIVTYKWKKDLDEIIFKEGALVPLNYRRTKPKTVAKFKYINNTLLVSNTLLLFCGPHVTYFRLTKGHVTLFWLETNVANFLHLMVLFKKMFSSHISKHQFVMLLHVKLTVEFRLRAPVVCVLYWCSTV